MTTRLVPVVGAAGVEVVLGERVARVSADPRGARPRVPPTIDVSVSGVCQYRCEWCWGPPHDVREQISFGDWQTILGRFASKGTRGVVFTGGEPLTSNMLPRLLRHAKEVGLRTTLSTNGLLLPRKADILEFVDDVGLGIDGPSAEIHSAMRAGSGRANGWRQAVGALTLAQAKVPDVTVRTVVAAQNVSTVPEIPAALRECGVDLARLRIKLYQIEPIGPHLSVKEWQTWRVDDDAVVAAAKEIRRRHPDLAVAVQLFANTRGRYFQIDPAGRAYGVDLGSDGMPVEVPYGNVVRGFDAALSSYAEHKQALAVEGAPERVDAEV